MSLRSLLPEIYRNIDYVYIVVIEAGQNAWLFRRLATADLAGISFPETSRDSAFLQQHNLTHQSIPSTKDCE